LKIRTMSCLLLHKKCAIPDYPEGRQCRRPLKLQAQAHLICRPRSRSNTRRQRGPNPSDDAKLRHASRASIWGHVLDIEKSGTSKDESGGRTDLNDIERREGLGILQESVYECSYMIAFNDKIPNNDRIENIRLCCSP
jgi:hypothetical protein